MSTPALWLLAAVGGYLLGSVSFGILSARLFGLGDLRRIGSGNPGATNVLRTGNRSAAALTLLGDAAKGGLAVVVARALAGPEAALFAGLGAFAGHCAPLWHGFRGGKGVATYLGTLLALHWPLGLLACGSWLAVAAIGRISSLAALGSAALVPPAALLMGRPGIAAAGVLLGGLLAWRHRENIARLRAGTEPRIGA